LRFAPAPGIIRARGELPKMTRSGSDAPLPTGISGEEFRPRIALRIGVTGHRDLAARYGQAAWELDRTVKRLLGAIAAGAAAAGGKEAGEEAYASSPPHLRLLSSLAEGADRLVAEASAAFGCRLLAVLPFPEPVYEEDFEPPSRTAFRALLARAHAEEGIVALDGGRGAYVGEHSYGAAGRFIVRNCDLLIAVWEYGRRGGFGGTADTIEYALRYDLPVIWIPADAPAEPRLLDGPFALVGKPPAADDVEAAVRDRVAGLLRPPLWRPLADRHRAALVRWWRALPYRRGSPYRQFLAEGSPQPRGLAGSYRLFLSFFAAPLSKPGEAAARPPPPEAPASIGAAALRRIGERCDGLALYYSACHRSAFLGIYLFAALALTLAILEIAYPAMEGVGGLGEVVSLFLIAALVLCDRLRRWHDRWIDYRSIAEVLRQTAHLSALGRALPARAVLQLTRQPAPEPRASDWTAWYLQAVLRQVPPPAARYDRQYLDRVRAAFVDDLIEGQIAYYQRTGETARRVSEFLTRYGLLAFALTIVLGLLKLALLPAGGREWLVPLLALLAAILPVASAAFMGLRAQAEFEVIASGSLRLAERLRQSGPALRRLELGAALSSERLAGAMFALSRLMLGEVEDWATLFDEKRIKAN
jgi:hypothetical protein